MHKIIYRKAVGVRGWLGALCFKIELPRNVHIIAHVSPNYRSRHCKALLIYDLPYNLDDSKSSVPLKYRKIILISSFTIHTSQFRHHLTCTPIHNLGNRVLDDQDSLISVTHLKSHISLEIHFPNSLSSSTYLRSFPKQVGSYSTWRFYKLSPIHI